MLSLVNIFGYIYINWIKSGYLKGDIMTIRRGSVVTCRIGNEGERGFKPSVPVKVVDIKDGKNGNRIYWFRILGLLVVGFATVSKNKGVDLFCNITNHVGCEGQMPSVKGVRNQTDALVHLGYVFE